MHPALRLRFVPEAQVTADEDAAIRAMLVAAFPQYQAIFTVASFFGAPVEHRLWLETPEREIVAHLDFGTRQIAVGTAEVLIAGVGGGATHPRYQGMGLGRCLMTALTDILRTAVPVAFGLLGCREAMVPYYERVGWHRIAQSVHELNPYTHEWGDYSGPTLILPARKPITAWPRTGRIELRGMPW